MGDTCQFPDGFLWGTATAAYQIEGAAGEDGRGESIWDRFSHTPGRVHQGETGDVACDHYHRFREDIALMRDLGIRNYRLSLSWPRLFPGGSGPANPKGFEFYNALIDALLAAGITPMVTLYHWDLPRALEDAGGWPNPETAVHFANYADAAFAAFGDRVPRWITLNEPWCTAHLGYTVGEHAPGHRDLSEGLQAGHTLLLAHGLATRKFRERCPNGQIGITDNVFAVHPTSESEADLAAVQRWDAFMNRWFLDPIHHGDYPAELRAAFGARLPEFTDAQRDIVRSPLDFLGVNYYSRDVMGDNPDDGFLGLRWGGDPRAPRTAMGWEIYPAGLTEVLCRLRDDYGNPVLYITENGAAFNEAPGSDGIVHDENRRVFLRDHFLAAHEAIAEGVRLAGYFVWSLMDNFEWSHGYSKRFGIVHVDYQTQRRTPKKSACWFSDVAALGAVRVEEQ